MTRGLASADRGFLKLGALLKAWEMFEDLPPENAPTRTCSPAACLPHHACRQAGAGLAILTALEWGRFHDWNLGYSPWKPENPTMNGFQ